MLHQGQGHGEACKLALWGRIVSGQAASPPPRTSGSRLPRRQSDKLLFCPFSLGQLSRASFPGEGLTGVFSTPQHISVNCCLSQGLLHFRTQISVWDAGLSELQCLLVTQAALLPSHPFFPQSSIKSLSSGAATHHSHWERDRQALCPLGAYALVGKKDVKLSTQTHTP